MGNRRTWLVSAALAIASSLLVGAAASANPILMPTLPNELAKQNAIVAAHQAINPPAPPCPETGMLPEPFSNCGLPEAPATTLPYPGNMAYWGGHVQVTPKVYIVYFGWGEPGAFPASATCKPRTLTEGAIKARLKCDPDGAGGRMADFVYQMGGTSWARVSTQYFQRAGGSEQHINNPGDVLAGIWVDDRNPANLSGTSAENAPGAGNTYTDLAAEAARAAKHFAVSDLANADFVIAQPPKFSDPNALASGYCAFHDYTEPGLEHGIYNGIRPEISYTNMPYVLAINSEATGGGQVNDCGENAVNSGPAGKLDGESIVLGHEIEETVTDPGAEDIQGGSGLGNQQYLGGWYDAADANENGDKCAWVGEPLVGGIPGEPNVLPIPGAMGDVKGNQGTSFAVQSLWSNEAAAGTGFCAGTPNELP